MIELLGSPTLHSGRNMGFGVTTRRGSSPRLRELVIRMCVSRASGERIFVSVRPWGGITRTGESEKEREREGGREEATYYNAPGKISTLYTRILRGVVVPRERHSLFIELQEEGEGRGMTRIVAPERIRTASEFFPVGKIEPRAPARRPFFLDLLDCNLCNHIYVIHDRIIITLRFWCFYKNHWKVNFSKHMTQKLYAIKYSKWNINK